MLKVPDIRNILHFVKCVIFNFHRKNYKGIQKCQAFKTQHLPYHFLYLLLAYPLTAT